MTNQGSRFRPDPIQTSGYEDGDEWVITGHKWFFIPIEQILRFL